GVELGAVPATTQRKLAIANLIVSIVGGIVTGVGDALRDNEPVILGQAALLLGLVSAAITTPNIFSDSLTELDWSAWGITVATALTNSLSSINFSKEANATFEPGPLSSALESGLGVAELLVLGLQWDPAYGEAPTNPLAEAALGINMVTTLPDLINP